MSNSNTATAATPAPKAEETCLANAWLALQESHEPEGSEGLDIEEMMFWEAQCHCATCAALNALGAWAD